MSVKSLVYYITPHGYGHAVRSLEVIRRMLEMMPNLKVTIVSDLPDSLIEQCVGRTLPQRRRRLDVGLVQKDSLDFDLAATLATLEQLLAGSERTIREEVRFLEAEGAAGIVSDISFLPFHASFHRSIPSIGVSNFSWDWIYESYAYSNKGWREVIDWIREGYRRCDLFLQLPMHGDCSVFPRTLDVPLIARASERSREELRRILADGSDRRMYLVSFASLEVDRQAQERLGSMGDRAFFYRRPLDLRHAPNAIALDDLPLSYNETVAAVDGVITKPGYGIVADCLVHGTPMLYTDRGDFPEYEILVDEIRRRLTGVFIPSSRLRSGDWEQGLKELEEAPRRFHPVGTDGGEVCARTILSKFFGNL